MPTAVPSVCRCGGIVRAGVCSKCGPRRERVRSKAERPHNSKRWQKHSHAYLSDHPLCVDCEAEGRTTLATETHHIAKVRQHADKMYDDDNLMALCTRCHSTRTSRGE